MQKKYKNNWVNNWNKRASEIYPEILNILAEEE